MKSTLVKIVLTAILGLTTAAPIASFATYYKTAYIDNSSANIEAKILKTIDADKMFTTIENLSKSPRLAGTKQEDKAVSHIKNQFESYGYETELQEFTFTLYTAPQSIELAVDGFHKAITPSAFEYTSNGKASGQILAAGLGRPSDYKDLHVNGKVVLLKRGEISFAEKIKHAASNGAAGVIIYNNEYEAILGSLGAEHKDSVPAVLLTKEEGELLAAHLKKNPGSKATLKVEGAKAEERTSHNVIATKSPTLKNGSSSDILVISSHHDSVAKAPGANDNASGTAMTLELARVLKNIPSDTEIRFITFGAEEFGLLGSTHYVGNLPKTEVSRIVANFNLDMVGSKDAGELIMQTFDKKANLVTELAQSASNQLYGRTTPFTQSDRSDHVPFAKAGIPAALFIHNPPEPWYHTADDSIDKISKAKLQNVAEIVSIAVWKQVSKTNQKK